ncbi:hypothetical protein KO524_12275, partial [Flavobacterium sp. NKUCC04_CG]|nr:hypothetical protein [Flavobacterium sp. NKUCC04_CG]
MKRKLLPLAALFISGISYAQVGVGTLTPSKSSQIDIVATDKGILIPRVELQNPTDATTITHGNVESLLVYNKKSNSNMTPGYYYWYDNKWVRLLSNADTSNINNTTNVELSVVGADLVLKDSDGNIVSVPLADINAADIITTLISNSNATYVYTSEDGTQTTIDVPADVINNFEEILNDNTVLQQLITHLTNTYVGGNVYYDGTQFTYIDQAGNTHIINFEDIVQA